LASVLARSLRLALAALLGLAAPGIARAQDPAAAVVEELHAALLEAMRRADELGYEGRYRQLVPVIEKSYDLTFMARLAIGRAWRELGEAEQARWLQTFREFSFSTYAARFDGFSGEHFETEAVEDAPHGTKLVRTRLVRPDDEPVRLHYRLRREGDAWRIIDVYLNGTVSEVALRRSEFATVLEREGFEGLVSDLREKIESYARGEGPSEST
jgi:phospholipid transport system substrate-binding protein